MGAAEHASIRPTQPRETPLTELAERFGLTVVGNAAGVIVTGITLNSRDVRPGDLFVGMPGAKRHGVEFAEQAAALGAVAILTDGAGEATGLATGLPVLVSQEHPREILGDVSSYVYGTRELGARVFGVTGTNGKTSIVYMLDTLMQACGMTVGISTTAERRIGQSAITSDLTTPEASEMHGLLGRMVEGGSDGIALEVSAQAIERHRIDGIAFDVVAFNNLSQDHLDEFHSMETYYEAKRALFTPRHARTGVVVVDSAWGQRLARESEIPVVTLATEYGQEADWHLAVTRETLDGISFVIQGPEGAHFRGSIPLFGKFMAENAALALIMLHESGIPIDEITAHLDRGRIPVSIPGRLEEMTNSADGPRFFVDYGHTPGSFESMLDALANVVDGRIIFLFGADGDRDTTKRAEMGRIAAAGSQILIICDYHPRWEDPAAIRAQLLEGARLVKRGAQIHEIADPREAIRAAISMAETGDVILYAGPGHEDYQEVAGELRPYSARDEVRAALREAGILQ